MPRVRNWPDFVAALFFLGFAAGAAALCAGLEVGIPSQMGPGYAPLLLAGVLAVLGTLLLLDALAGGEARMERVRIRPLIVISASFTLFGLAVEPLGLAIAVALTAFAGGLAIERGSALKLAAVSVALAAGCVVVFVMFLGLPLTIWPA